MERISKRYIPPPISEGKHEITFIITELERVRLVEAIIRGICRNDSPITKAGNDFLEILGVPRN